MIQQLSGQELATMRQAGRVASQILRQLKRIIKPGILTKDIETFFDKALAKHAGMEAAFKGYNRYPASLCVSLNEEVIHGIPSSRRQIKDGDLVSVDLGIKYQGLFVDAAYTYLVGQVAASARRLAKVARRALREGIKQAQPGAKVGDVSASIQQLVEKNGLSVVRQFVGHGIGRKLHAPPEVPNFGQAGAGRELCPGYAIAIEPMVSAGRFEVEVLADGWTAKTRDNSLTAHFEHTVAVTARGPWVLTS